MVLEVEQRLGLFGQTVPQNGRKLVPSGNIGPGYILDTKLNDINRNIFLYGHDFETTDPISNPIERSTSSSSTANSRSEADLIDEIQRIRTFYGWPPTAPVTPYTLAKWGFIYTGTSDRVKCVFCGLVLHCWEPGDIVFDEHRKNSPTCPLIVKNSETNTTPARIEQPTRQTHSRGSILSPSTINRGDSMFTLPIINYINFSRDQISFPQYKELDRRIRSYINSRWPSTAAQSPKQLSECGFFYTGESDKVKCYVCGGNLKDWKETDNPWTEHAKWYPDCELVIHVEGSKIKAKGLPSSFYHGTTQKVPSTGHASLTGAAANYPSQPYNFSDREVKARLDTPMVQTVLQRGFSKKIVKKAIERQLNTRGDDFPGASDLLKAVLEIEQEEEEVSGSNTAGGARNYSQSEAELSSPGRSAVYNNVSLPPSTASRSHGGASLNISGNTAAKQVYTQNVSGSANSHIPSMKPTVPLQSAPPNDVKQLEERVNQLKEERMCKICMDADADVVFIPCGHFMACSKCAAMLRQCPICRKDIENVVKTFIS